jgi:hypothetical protein
MVEFLTIVDLAVQFRLGPRAFETLIEASALTVKGRLAREVDEMGERIEQGILTGEIEQPVVWGPAKASGVQQFAAEHQVNLGSSY